MATKYKLQDAHLLQGRDIFVDTNVLIYLFWPTGQYDYEKNYARVFSFLRKQRNHLFVDIFVISEIINRTLRNEHTKLQPALKFKEFRDSNITGNPKILH